MKKKLSLIFPGDLSGRVTSYYCTGRYIFCNHSSGSYNSVFTNCDTANNSSITANGSAFLHECFYQCPIFFCLQCSIFTCGSWIKIVGEHHTMAYKNIILQFYPGTDKSMTGYFTILSNDHFFLYFCECTYFASIADRTFIGVHKTEDTD